MGKLPGKLLFFTIVYIAGFVTAVYFLAPESASATDHAQVGKVTSWLQQLKAENADTDSKEWVTKIRTGIDTSIDFAEENANRLADLIRSKMAQGKTDSSSQTAVE